jgi:hypothetical protein
MGQSVSQRPVNVKARFAARYIFEGFMVDEVVLGQVFLWVFRFLPDSKGRTDRRELAGQSHPPTVDKPINDLFHSTKGSYSTKDMI